MYIVRVRTPEGELKEKTVFSEVRSALRHLDAYIRAFPDHPAEIEGAIGVLMNYEPLKDDRPAFHSDIAG